MNILDITNEDIARLKTNGTIWGKLSERDKEIFKLVGCENCGMYNSDDLFIENTQFPFNRYWPCFQIKMDYTLPAHTEADIIAYLQASEVPPAQWHPAAQEWSRRHKLEPVWEFMWSSGAWSVTNSVMKSYDMFSDFPHRLRADYGKETVKEPETCECGRGPMIDRTNIEINFKTMTVKCFCPACGKRIEAKNEHTYR